MIINSPVLLPFGKDINIIKDLEGKKVYIYPQYKFWGKNLEILINNIPTKYTMDYIREKINEDYTGIIKRSKYKQFLDYVFNEETSTFLDTLYQIELDKNHRDILVLLITTEMENFADDLGFKKVEMNLEKLNYMFDNLNKYLNTPNLKQVDVNFVKEDIGNSKFVTIYDSITRLDRIYSPHFLGFVSMFTGRKEIQSGWYNRLAVSLNINLIHGGYLILRDYPREYKTKIKNLLKNFKFEKLEKNVWKKPDIKVKKITKGIKNYY